MKRRLVVLEISLVLVIFAVAEAKTLKLFWEPSIDAPYLVGYNVYWSYNRAEIANKTISPAITTSKPCYCFEVSENNPAVYFGITAVDDRGMESEIVVGYYLFGNVNGDVEFNLGKPWGDTKVDGADLTLMRPPIFGSKVVHGNLDCNSCAYTGAWPPSTAEKCDLNGDGVVNGFDLIELGLRFGNAVQ